MAKMMRVVLIGFETTIYGLVGMLLVAAAVFALVGTGQAVADAISGHKNAAEVGLLLLDRILLILIVAELVYTLRFVVLTHEIAAEPFLFVGLIAVVRRILIVTGEFEQPAGGRELTNFLIELGLLGFLTLTLSAAIYLVRRSERTDESSPRHL